MKLLVVIMTCFAIPALAADISPVTVGPEYIEVGELVEIRGWHPDAEVYEIHIQGDNPAGPFFATPEKVARAIHAISLRTVRRSPESIVASGYKTDHKLEVLIDDEVELRRQKSKR